ncbi:MAG: DNA repair protein RecN [Gemmatimonadetes bacterium]|nr:DNA repair protein RecN [Gemmatimonadota bacterium]
MLIEIRIRDYAVIDDLRLELGPGLVALTGETGAGKSIIVGALSLLLGERASSESVRVGAEKAVVEGVFDVSDRPEVLARLEEQGMQAEDGLLILRREVAAEGRNRAWVCGSPATASLVGELGRSLVDLHGQHEHQTLLHAAEQRGVLDAFAGAGGLAARVRLLHEELRSLERELEAREARRREIESRADFLRFQASEIADAELEAGEDEALDDEARRLEHAEELAEDASALHQGLYGGEDSVSDRLAELRSILQRLARIDGSLADTAGMLETAYHQVVESGRALGDYAASVEHDPGRIEKVRQRLDLLFRLKRKYGPDLADVLETLRRVRGELEELEASSLDLEALSRRREAAGRELAEAAAELSARRSEAAGRLEERVEALLPELGMPGAVFRVGLQSLAAPGAGGAEAVEFRASLNPGFEPRALARIASGGELSRVMLALKSILADVDRVPTLVFDEVDAGIGGTVASAVARKLREVARTHQVFVITHLPQLASLADGHLLVEKTELRGVAATRVGALDGEPRVREIARMLGGDPESATSRDHARELLRAG